MNYNEAKRMAENLKEVYADDTFLVTPDICGYYVGKEIAKSGEWKIYKLDTSNSTTQLTCPPARSDFEEPFLGFSQYSASHGSVGSSQNSNKSRNVSCIWYF